MGKVMKNCKIGGCPSRGHNTCPTCKEWTPSRSHKYYRCTRYQLHRITCTLPEGSCPTCPFFEKPQNGKGRPNFSGADWRDPEDSAAARREIRKENRVEHLRSQIAKLEQSIRREADNDE